VIHHYVYTANGTTRLVPTPGAENFRFNLWLFQSTAPAGNQSVQVVVNDFAFLPLLPGDFNNDGAVDGLDLARWQGDFGQNRDSDADADGDSDGDDFLTWQRHAGASLSAVNRAVPEPTSAMQALGVVLAGISFRRRRR
jgi:hypothetical protein